VYRSSENVLLVKDLMGHADIAQSERYAMAAIQEHQVTAVSALSKVARRGAAGCARVKVRFRPPLPHVHSGNACGGGLCETLNKLVRPTGIEPVAFGSGGRSFETKSGRIVQTVRCGGKVSPLRRGASAILWYGRRRLPLKCSSGQAIPCAMVIAEAQS
jgi:hypothetical protein